MLDGNYFPCLCTVWSKVEIEFANEIPCMNVLYKNILNLIVIDLRLTLLTIYGTYTLF